MRTETECMMQSVLQKLLIIRSVNEGDLDSWEPVMTLSSAYYMLNFVSLGAMMRPISRSAYNILWNDAS